METVTFKIQRFLLMPTWFVFSPLLRIMVHIDFHFPDVTKQRWLLHLIKSRNGINHGNISVIDTLMNVLQVNTCASQHNKMP